VVGVKRDLVRQVGTEGRRVAASNPLSTVTLIGGLSPAENARADRLSTCKENGLSGLMRTKGFIVDDPRHHLKSAKSATGFGRPIIKTVFHPRLSRSALEAIACQTK